MYTCSYMLSPVNLQLGRSPLYYREGPPRLSRYQLSPETKTSVYRSDMGYLDIPVANLNGLI